MATRFDNDGMHAQRRPVGGFQFVKYFLCRRHLKWVWMVHQLEKCGLVEGCLDVGDKPLPEFVAIV